MNYRYRMDLPADPPEELHGYDAERDPHVFELTGIWPDPRYFVPLEETKEMIWGVQAGASEAAEALIATRLRWVCDKYTQGEVAASRDDLELEDFLHVAGLAVTYAAQKVDAGSMESSGSLIGWIPGLMDRIVTDGGGLLLKPPLSFYKLLKQGKLLPSVKPDGSIPLYMQEIAASPDVIPAGVETGALIAMGRDRSDGPLHPSAEDAAIDRIVLGTAFEIMAAKLDARQRLIAEAQFGLNGHIETQAETSRRLGVSRSRVGQVEGRIIEKLSFDPELSSILDVEDGVVDDHRHFAADW